MQATNSDRALNLFFFADVNELRGLDSLVRETLKPYNLHRRQGTVSFLEPRGHFEAFARRFRYLQS